MAERKRRRGTVDRRAATERQPGPIGRAVRALVLGTLRLVWRYLWRAGAVGGLILAGATAHYYQGLPSADSLFDGRAGGSVTLLDRHGSVFAWRGEQYGGDLRADDVSPHLIHAVVATEDRRYWDHIGLDPRGLARALYANILAGRIVQGGSTLTQQVAKNVFLDAERSLDRKLKEAPMALALELKYTKEEILSIYLNRVYLGAGTYGFEAAARRYFGKSSRGLTPAEAAMLAGLLRAPSRYAPTSDLARAQGRASVIVRLMHEQGYLTEPQVFEALANPARLSQAASAEAGGYFADWVMETAPSYLTRRTTEDVVIATTFDPKLQTAVERAVEAVFEAEVKPDSVAEAAVVVMTPKGAVRAMVGGRKPGAGRFNRATHAKRQTGSAFKPVVYAAALEQGMRPADRVADAPITIDGWSPENYDREFRGPVTLTQALAHSINAVAVRVSERAGRAYVRALAREMGITTALAPGPALALGTSETTLTDMTGVYATIANRGVRATPYGLTEIRLRGEAEALMRRPELAGERVISERSAGLLTHMLSRVIAEGTGRRAALADRPAAGKTGTTQAARDAWFIGFTADYVTGVWMGNDDNTPLTGVTGGGLPAEIWRRVMIGAHEGRPVRPLPAIRPGGRGTTAPDTPLPGPASGGEDGLVRSILEEVVEGLGRGAGRDRPHPAPQPGAER